MDDFQEGCGPLFQSALPTTVSVKFVSFFVIFLFSSGVAKRIQ